MSAVSSNKFKEYRHARIIQWLAVSPRTSVAPPHSLEAEPSRSSNHNKHRRHRHRSSRDLIDDKRHNTSASFTSPHRSRKRDKLPVIHNHLNPISPPTPPPTASTPPSSPTSDVISISSSIAVMPNDNRPERSRNGHDADLPRRPRPRRPAQERANSPGIADPIIDQPPTMSWYEAGRELQKRGVNVTIDLANLYPDPASPEAPTTAPDALRLPSSTTTAAGPFTIPAEALHALLPLKAVLEFKAPQVLSAASSLTGLGGAVVGNSGGVEGPDGGGMRDNLRDDVPSVTCHQCGDSFDSEADRERHFEREDTYCSLCKRNFECAGRMWGRGHVCAVLLGRVRGEGFAAGGGGGGGWGNGGLGGLGGFNGVNVGWGFGQGVGPGVGVGGLGREAWRARGFGERARERDREGDRERDDWE